MKRCLLVAAILVGINYGLASADYMVVKIDLNQILHPPAKQAPTTGTAKQLMPGPGTYMPPIMPNPGAKGGGKAGGKKGAAGGYSQPIQPKQYPQQYPPIQPGTMPLQPGQPGATPTPPPPAEHFPPVFVYAYLELRSDPQANKSVGVPEFDYKLDGQKMKLWLTDKNPSGAPIAFYIPKIPPVDREFDKKFEKLLTELKAGVDESKKQKLIVYAGWALQRGLLERFDKCIDELKKHDAKHAVVVAVEKARAQLKETPKADDPAAQTIIKDLQNEGYRGLTSEQGHYTLLTNIKSTTTADAGLKKKLAKLERVHTTFFYWFAFKGEPRTPPDKRLVVVLIDTPTNNSTDFMAKHKAFDYVPMVGSGFTAQRDNVIFMASRRMDEAYEMLATYNQQQWDTHKTNMNDLLTNILAVANQRQFTKPADLQLTQTLTLCQRAMEEENDTVTLSHEGIRQLIAATGLLPSNVQTAEWARFGLASFFEVPPDAFYPSTGGPNWTHLINFKVLRHEKKLDQKDAKEILLKVITDEYLRQAYGTLHDVMLELDDRATLNQQANQELELARATSWSLMYYLMQNKDKELQHYFMEINNLPRDTDYDGKILRDCFCRAFGLMSSDPANPGRQMVNATKFESLAKDWLSAMDRVRLEDIPGYEELALKLKNPETTRPPVITQPVTGVGAVMPQLGPMGGQPIPGKGAFPQPGLQKKGKGP